MGPTCGCRWRAGVWEQPQGGSESSPSRTPGRSCRSLDECLTSLNDSLVVVIRSSLGEMRQLDPSRCSRGQKRLPQQTGAVAAERDGQAVDSDDQRWADQGSPTLPAAGGHSSVPFRHRSPVVSQGRNRRVAAARTASEHPAVVTMLDGQFGNFPRHDGRCVEEGLDRLQVGRGLVLRPSPSSSVTRHANCDPSR